MEAEITAEEIKKCKESPYYFATKYLLINGKPFTTRLNEVEFNKQVKQILESKL